MPMMDALVAWVQSLPPVAYFLVVGLCAVLESFFPPIHNVVLVAAVLAASEKVSMGLSLAVITVGHMLGMSAIYWTVRHFGAERVHKYLSGKKGGMGKAEARVHALYERWGIPALFLARLIPGPRLMVAPITGALALPFVRSIIAMTLATPVAFAVLVAFSEGLARWF